MTGPLQCYCDGLFNNKRWDWVLKHKHTKNPIGKKEWTEQEKEDKEHCMDYATGAMSAYTKGEAIKYLIIILNTVIRKVVIAIVERLGYDS